MDAMDIVMRFVNTRADGAGHVEQFGTGQDFAGWAIGHGLLTADDVVTDSDATAARELRGALVTLLLAHACGTGVDEARIADAERYLMAAGARYALAAVVTLDGARLSAGAAGVPGMFGSVLAAVTEVAQRGNWARAKACGNPPCQLGFVDRTRNRAGRYCSPGCGSQASMRNFRERQRRGVC